MALLLGLGIGAESVWAADPVAIVDALKTNAGNPKGARASFAKGQCVRGNYTPSTDAASVTKSASFTKPGMVLARFSVGGGNPKVLDTNKAVLRGFSMKLGEGKNSTDILFENAPVHFAKSTDQMLGFLKARAPGPDGKPDADKVKAFSAENPETLNQAHFVASKPMPGSFAGVTYWGVHAFPATNSKGQKRFIKFKVVPVDGDVNLTEEEAKTKPEDFLFQDIKARLAAGGIKLQVLALLDQPGDPTMDVTVRWPDEDNRPAVALGTVTITALSENQPCDDSIFVPGNLAAGIGEPPDEIFAARKAAYPVSLARRKSE
ncbi:catalase [Duganella sp. FT135W]|uniref:Catalase-related peroxidase n=2 Tax=Duganella flavida TaxID=2692175 RepID=A0A6L8KDY2_9BURK|nr:catalase [Duganella flavida]